MPQQVSIDGGIHQLASKGQSSPTTPSPGLSQQKAVEIVVVSYEDYQAGQIETVLSLPPRDSAGHSQDRAEQRDVLKELSLVSIPNEEDDLGLEIFSDEQCLDGSVSALTKPEDVSLVRQVSLGYQVGSFFLEHYFSTVAPIFTICDGNCDPFSAALLPYLSTEGPLGQALAAIASLHVSNSRNDAVSLDYAVAMRSQTIARVRRQLFTGSTDHETVATCLMLAATEVRFPFSNHGG